MRMKLVPYKPPVELEIRALLERGTNQPKLPRSNNELQKMGVVLTQFGRHYCGRRSGDGAGVGEASQTTKPRPG